MQDSEACLRKRCKEPRVFVDGGSGLAFDVVVEIEVVLEVNLNMHDHGGAAAAAAATYLELAVSPTVLHQLRLQVLYLRLQLPDLRLAKRLQVMLHGLQLVPEHDGRGARLGGAIMSVTHV